MEIINIKTYKHSDFIWGARGSIFGNPFEIGRDGTRKEIIQKYEKWFNFAIKDPVFRNAVISLKYKKVGCFCNYPIEDCHLRIIKNYLDNLK